MEPAHSNTDIYLEAFAVYLACFALGRGLLQSFPEGLIALIAALIVQFSSLLGIFWPALRGVPLRAMAKDLGFHRGQGWWTEIRAGLVGYAAVLPFFAAGVIVMFILRVVLDRAGVEVSVPLHPDMVGLGEISTARRFLLLGVASLLAPLIEETMFRGALFRALRSRWGFWVSASFSALIFAAVHPQGLLAIPPLAGLAIGFSALREWRGSLIAPMIAHGIHNAVLVLLATILLS